jgi:hypothetical protein
MRKLILPLLLFFSGCASVSYKVTGWGNDSDRLTFDNGKSVRVIGNPQITCYDKNGVMIANGLFVAVQGNYMEVDEWGVNYVWLADHNSGNWCQFWKTE